MPSKTCNQCHGSGQLDNYSEYESCYSCGGSGHGSYTDIACSSCNGSGRSTTPIKESCWQCGGAGSTYEPDPVYTPPKTTKASTKQSTKKQSTNQGNTSSTKSKSSLNDNILGIAVVLTVILVAVLIGEDLPNEQIAFLGFIAFVGSYIGAYIIYYAVKIGVVVLFYGGLFVLGAYWMEFEWALELVNSFK